MVKFHFITLFPETIDVWLRTSILGRAREQGVFDFELHQLRDYSDFKHRSVDDTAYGGGGGMVLRLEPLVKAVEHIEKQEPHPPQVIYFSPKGKRLTTPLISEMARDHQRSYILVCGHYEGVDQRFIDYWVDLELSLGDFVLTGGEIPAVAFVDSFVRQLEGTVSHDARAQNESFSLVHPETGETLLEYPHYTRPAEFRDLRVPDVLLQGNHAEIDRWRLSHSRNAPNND